MIRYKNRRVSKSWTLLSLLKVPGHLHSHSKKEMMESFVFFRNYLRLNYVTQEDRYCMLRPEELLDWVGQAKFIMTLDMIESISKCPWMMMIERKQYLSCLQGNIVLQDAIWIKECLSTFQRLVDEILIFDFEISYVAVYINDVAIFSDLKRPFCSVKECT